MRYPNWMVTNTNSEYTRIPYLVEQCMRLVENVPNIFDDLKENKLL